MHPSRPPARNPEPEPRKSRPSTSPKVRRRSAPHRLLSTPELAAVLDRSPRSIQMWRNAGIISPERIEVGRPRWRYATVRAQLERAIFQDGRRLQVARPAKPSEGGA